MPTTSSFPVPLPDSWPKHAKAATLHVISLAHFALTQVRGWAANSLIHRVRLSAERNQLNSEVAMLREEIRIKDARMATLVPHRRPHYSPCERMAILQLMAARGWSKAQAGRRFLVTDETVASWNGRLEEDGPGGLVEATVPVNKFPDFVAAMVIKLKTLFPMMGRRRIADFLARAGLHIAPSTVRRMLKSAPATETPAPVAPAKNPGEPLSSTKPHTVIANYPKHVWGIDTTAVPTSAGFWTSWFPFSLAQSWPFCWWVAVVIDHSSRRSLGLAAFKRRPTADEICIVLDEVARRAGRVPKYTVSDQGSEFGEEYLEWCDDHDVRARFGALGRHGNIAVEERFTGSCPNCTNTSIGANSHADRRHRQVIGREWSFGDGQVHGRSSLRADESHSRSKGRGADSTSERALMIERSACETRGKLDGSTPRTEQTTCQYAAARDACRDVAVFRW
jgi:transposase InsO family protein